ncbi:MAG TPA: hypothetical protein VM554_02845 [Acidisarcina sp.]|nr:hypothetical protein [Acidisarcina sp.]
MQKSLQPKEVKLFVGTRKGGFAFSSDMRRKTWQIHGPFFAGTEMNYLGRDARTGHLWAAITSAWWGTDLQVSRNQGKTWQKSSNGIGFAKDRGLNLSRIWRVVPDRNSRPDVLWCGADPGALFRSDNGGKDWYEVTGLTQHSTRERWQPGGGGLMVHCILPDPANGNRVYAGISAAGCFRTDDDGQSWQPLNKGVLADFAAKKYPEVGQCVHSMHLSASNPDLLFQQNHCGVYSSRNAAEEWTDISEGLPSRFGFASVVHPHQAETMYVIPEISSEQRYVCDSALNVYRTRNGGKTWRKLTRGLPRKNVYTQVLRHAATTDTCEDAAVYVGTTNGAIYYSRDGGNSWEGLAENLPPIMSLEASVA